MERLLYLLLLPSLLAFGQVTRQADSSSTPTLPAISLQAQPGKPFSVIGPRGALLGQQDGKLEAWIFPWKVFSNLSISAKMQDYAVPIDVNEHAAQIDVQPYATTITYSHANFSVRQIMFAPKSGPPDAGALFLYQVDAVRPLDLTFSFTPVMQRMWPALSEDHPSPEWVADQPGGGFYMLHLNFPDHAAAIAMPGATSGILPPYQERAANWPLQFVLHYDPVRDKGKFFPLLLVFAETQQAATKQALAARLSTLASGSTQLLEANRTYYQDFVATHTSLESPDPELNAALSWAEIAIDQLRVKVTPSLDEQALTAGFVGSGDAARPGFGWFFGRDGLWSLYAVASYGDPTTLKEEISFLLKRQRADGKMMHEWSQTANLVDWAALPYQYASADATLLLPMVVDDYLKISGDRDFVNSIWPNLERAWTFETSHDSDGDGIYENTEGSGWVESWVPSMPHQEVYLAALDQQASRAFGELAHTTGHEQLAAQARARAQKIATQIEQEYYLPDKADYAFSRNANGSTDNTPTIFPSVAWWDGTYSLGNSDAMISRWASSEFSTDWGTRILSDKVSFYDPISYHQGTVWPLFTGWVSVAEYRTGHPLSAYAHLMQNVNLTWAQDPGSVTELLSGKFYQVLGRSTAHQLWSSAMIISPLLRGMFGLEWNVADRTLAVTPHLPAMWPGATLRHVPFGSTTLDLAFTRNERELRVTASGPAVASGLKLISHAPGAHSRGDLLSIPLPAVEAGITEELPEFGAETHQMKVLSEQPGEHVLVLHLSAPAGTQQTFTLRENQPGLHLVCEGAELDVPTHGAGRPSQDIRNVHMTFPPGQGYTERVVRLTW